MADNGCQPTSLAFMRACAALSIRQVFTSYSNPLLADPEGGAGLAPRVDQPQRLLRRPRSLAWRVQRQLPPFGARLSSAECRRSRASRPRHSLSRGLLSCSRSSPWAGQRVSGMRRSRQQMAKRRADGGALRRRLSKLSCAGWLPHDRGFVSGLPRSKRERRSATVS
jgi:hypothetical protein